ncbi:unnamed protein product [Chrysodeixis includens]|uniref:Testis-expressed sequence 9 protein n=1 Tax=Chrysodeixis includens TaxID=689277 RepID=A0A9P0FYP7_CHRIL|nr:unnamed protein product [Chrysodeixis includens]
MDSLDLLAREDEFKKLNKQLQKKTESLMKEIEHAMQKKDIFSEFSQTLTLSPIHTTKKHSCDAHKLNASTPSPTHTKPAQKKKTKIQNGGQTNNHTEDSKFENETQNGGFEKNECNGKMTNVCNCCFNVNMKDKSGDAEFLYAFVAVNVKEKVLPESFLKDRPTIESVCKFLSSKVKLMQEQIDSLQRTIDKKASQCDGHLTQLAELESERMSLLNKANNLRAATADMKAKSMVLQAKYNDKDKQYKEQRSETDRLTCELKRYRIKCASVEAKAASQQETIDNLKQLLEIAKRSEKVSFKEFRESSRSLSSSHQSAISRLEAHIKTLNTRSDRQMALIDNLRRQNVLLTTDVAVKTIEKEYSDYLNQDF